MEVGHFEAQTLETLEALNVDEAFSVVDEVEEEVTQQRSCTGKS